MLKTTGRCSLFVIAALVLALAGGDNCVAEGPQSRMVDGKIEYPAVAGDATSFSILDAEGRPVLRYRYAEVPRKPYADQLHSPSGVQVLRDAPHDHLHHHALMFALSVDGVDFWGEFDDRNGKQIHRKIGGVNITNRDGLRRVSFTQELDWIGPKSDDPLMIEQRTIGEYRGADLGATLIEWRSLLKTPPEKESIELTGHHYFGLGVRFVESMDRDGRFFNSDDRQGEVVRGDERLTPAKWCAYSAKADGKPVTVAMFDHPSNLRHPALMFTMSKAFPYLSATMNVWKEPIELKSGCPLDLRYGVAVWDGEADKAAVERLYKRWLEISDK